MTKYFNLSCSILIAITLFLAACSQQDQGTSTETPFSYTANELMTDLEKNHEKTHRKLYLKAVKVTGELLEVDAGSLGAPLFVLKTKSKDRATIKCLMLRDDMQYEPGDEVTIKGFYQDHDFHVTLDKCVTVNED